MNFTVSMKQNHLFQRLYRKGNTAATPFLALYCRKNRSGTSQLGLTVSKKVGGAVTRNRVRRRLRAIYRLHEGQLAPGYDIVVVSRVRAATGSYVQLEQAFLRLAAQTGMLLKRDSAKTPVAAAKKDGV